MSVLKYQFDSIDGIPKGRNFVVVYEGLNGEIFADTYRSPRDGELEVLEGSEWTKVSDKTESWIPSDGYESVLAILSRED